MKNSVFDATARAALTGAYPERPVLLGHKLVGHPLFELPELVRLAERLPAANVEQNIGALPVGIDPEDVRHNGLTPAETIRSIQRNGSWMVLKFVEQDPTYRALLHNLLREIEPIVRPSTGEMLRKEAFIFVSSPRAVTPFHFDPEHNILLQLRGDKVMTIFPADDPEIASGIEHERFHLGGHRNLPYDERFAAAGRPFRLSPGEGVYVPVKAPHFVRNGDEVSVSFSITWRSEWSYRESDAHGMNAMLRKAGLTPKPPRRFPRDNRLKSVAYRGVGKVRQMLGRG